MSTESSENQSSEAQAWFGSLLQNRAPVEHKVGGITLLERWQRGFASHGVELSPRSGEEVLAELKSANKSQLLCLADWVIDMMGQEAIAESLSECQSGELLYFENDKHGLAPALALGTEAAQKLAQQEDFANASEPKTILDLAEAAGISTRKIDLPGKYWAQVSDKASAKKATWEQLKLLRWRPGGVVAKNINRPISIRLSKHLLDTFVTPNMTTWFAFVVGLVGIWLIFQAEYWSIVAGGFLLQLNSILDGIDGELARMRHKTSEFGAYLDSVCDEILNAALFIAMGYVLSKNGGWFDIPSELYFYLGIFVGTVAFTYSLAHWHCKWKHGLGLYWWFEAYKPRKEVQRSTSLFAYFKKLFWKESYLMLFFLAAVAEVYEALYWLAVPASSAVFTLLFIHIFIKRARW